MEVKLYRPLFHLLILLNMKVIAEGVETKEQLTVLQRNACYLIQGYYYSKPVNDDEFIVFKYNTK